MCGSGAATGMKAITIRIVQAKILQGLHLAMQEYCVAEAGIIIRLIVEYLQETAIILQAATILWGLGLFLSNQQPILL